MRVLGFLFALTFLFYQPLTGTSDFQVVEHLNGTPRGWIQGAVPSASTLLKLRLAVSQKRATEFEQHVIDISTPGHAKYGHHMTSHEIKDFLRPDTHASQMILYWLESEGVSPKNIVDDGDWINFVVSVGQAERMLNTHFYYFFGGVSRNVRRIRALEYSVPARLRPYVHMIQPTTRFGKVRAEKSMILENKKAGNISLPAGYNATSCNYTITPDCIRGLYGFGSFTGDRLHGNRLGISGFVEEFVQDDDVAAFMNLFNGDVSLQDLKVAMVNGSRNVQNSSADSSEANLDVEYALSLAQNTPLTFYSTPGRGPLLPDLDDPDPAGDSNEPYLDLLHYLLSLPDEQLPKVLSNSYGEDEQSVPRKYANATCSLFAQLGARGVSVLFASGDSGVGSACQSNDGTNRTRFNPSFPASCPFVTAVGGTIFVEPEQAIYLSGGGFSDYFPRPAYQDESVGFYLRDKLGNTTWSGLYNRAGRGIPDVAAQAMDFIIVDKGKTKLTGGTSAATPVVASAIALLNSLRLRVSLPPMGFLNPWLYNISMEKPGTYFTDIVDGGSTGCVGIDQTSGLATPVVPFASWNATEGWDPVTGWGTPRVDSLVGMTVCDIVGWEDESCNDGSKGDYNWTAGGKFAFD